jgi:hypothetical protein
VLVDADSFFFAHAPRLKALAKTATIMIAFKKFNVTRLLPLLVAPVPLGKDAGWRNAFLDFFGTAQDRHLIGG